MKKSVNHGFFHMRISYFFDPAHAFTKARNNGWGASGCDLYSG